MSNPTPPVPEPETQPRDHMLSNRVYNVIKFLALILLPALGSLYFALSQIWGLPKATEIVGTITVVDTFLGALVGLSTRSYNDSEAKYDGTMNVQDTGDKIVANLELRTDPHELINKDEILLNVHQPITTPQ